MIYEIKWPLFQSELKDLFGVPSRKASANSWLVFIDLSEYKDVLNNVKGFNTKEGFGFYGHELLATELPPVLDDLIQTGLIRELQTFDGCWNVREMKGGGGLSVHSWGLALDFNALKNPYGGKVTFSDKFIKVWADHGWESGALWKVKDGMHFQLPWTRNWLNRERTPLTPKIEFE